MNWNDLTGKKPNFGIVKKNLIQLETPDGTIVEIRTMRDDLFYLNVKKKNEPTMTTIEMNYETLFALALAMSWLEPRARRGATVTQDDVL